MKKNGFTFVELLVVITIMAVLFGIGTVAYSAISKNSRNARRSADLEAIRQALEMCRSIDGKYPTTLQSIYDSVTCPVSGTVTLNGTPIDPKPCDAVPGGEYTYDSNSSTYSITADCYDGDGGAKTVYNP